MTMYEYHLAREAHFARHYRELEYTRHIVYMLYRVNTTETPPKDTYEFWPLPSDPKQVAKPEITEEKKEELRQIALKRMENINFSTR